MAMKNSSNKKTAASSDDVNLEVVLQRIFNESDPVAHRAAIWELFQLSGDWELFEKLSAYGGEKGISAYFQNIIDQLEDHFESEDSISDQPIIPIEHKDGIRELYIGPLLCIRRSDWVGTAAAILDILITEIYDVYGIDENKLPFSDATTANLESWVGEEILFPLGVIEYMAYSNSLSSDLDPALLDNHLTLLLTLFFSAQAHLDVVESQHRPGIEPEDNSWRD